MAKSKTVDVVRERLILLLAGPSGAGKSFFIGSLSNALIFDTDIGGGLAYLDARIRRNGSERIEVGSYLDVIQELQKRRGKLQAIRTLAIDHLTTLQQEAVIRHNPSFAEGTFGKEHDKANKEWRKVRDYARFGDFNLVCTAHMKNKYQGKEIVGQLPDASKNVEADFSIVLELQRCSSYPSMARVLKWRRDPEDSRGLIPASFPFTLEDVIRLQGDFDSDPRREVPMATPQQIGEVMRLVEVVKLPEGELERWFTKAKAESWEDFTEEALGKCIAHLRSKLPTDAKPAA